MKLVVKYGTRIYCLGCPFMWQNVDCYWALSHVQEGRFPGAGKPLSKTLRGGTPPCRRTWWSLCALPQVPSRGRMVRGTPP